MYPVIGPGRAIDPGPDSCAGSGVSTLSPLVVMACQPGFGMFDSIRYRVPVNVQYPMWDQA